MTRSEARVAHLMLMRHGWRSRIIGWAGDLTKELSIEISVGKTRINLETFEDVRKFLTNKFTERVLAMVKSKEPKGPMEVINMGTSQPVDWVELFRSSASLEGLTFSEWVALACLDRAAWMSGKTAEELASGLSVRATRGRRPKGAESC